jgi:hypothetical protein
MRLRTSLPMNGKQPPKLIKVRASMFVAIERGASGGGLRAAVIKQRPANLWRSESSYRLKSHWQRAEPLSRGREDGVADGRRERRHAGLANT